MEGTCTKKPIHHVKVEYRDGSFQNLTCNDFIPAEHAPTIAGLLHQISDIKGKRIIVRSNFFDEDGNSVGNYETRFTHEEG